MKKNVSKVLFTFLVLSMALNTLYAQGPYVNLHTGYGLRMSSQNISFLSFENITSGANSNTYEQIDVSLGKGLNLGGAIGYMFNKNIGAELGVSYLIGSKYEAKDEYVGGVRDLTLSAKMLRINPTLVIASGFEKFNPYAKFGIVIGSGSILYEISNNDQVDLYEAEIVFNGGTALGLTSGVGAMYTLNKMFSIYGELNMINLSYAPTKGEFTKATLNGADELLDMTTNEKEIEFVDKYTKSTSGTPIDSEPTKILRQRFPFGSLGLNIGVNFRF
jgi:outer membrane protein W